MAGVKADQRHHQRRRKTRAYAAWIGMKSRCLNPKNTRYADYGGRGVTVHPAWINNFAAFYAEVGDAPSAKHTIDRINNSQNYEPGNVRWATPTEQLANRRNTITLTHQGRTLRLTEWAKERGVPYLRALQRFKRGEPFDQIFSTAVHSQRKTGELSC